MEALRLNHFEDHVPNVEVSSGESRLYCIRHVSYKFSNPWMIECIITGAKVSINEPSGSPMPFLNPDVHTDLRYQLERNLVEIKRRYASYVRCVRQSLQNNGVSAEDLCAYLLDFDAFQCSQNNETGLMLFSGKRAQLERASSI